MDEKSEAGQVGLICPTYPNWDIHPCLRVYGYLRLHNTQSALGSVKNLCILGEHDIRARYQVPRPDVQDRWVELVLDVDVFTSELRLTSRLLHSGVVDLGIACECRSSRSQLLVEIRNGPCALTC